jgi:hypothetical protein
MEYPGDGLPPAGAITLVATRKLQGWNSKMTLTDLTLMAFTLCNVVRVEAYLPQIWKAAIDENGAKAVSCLSWGLFLVSHLSTAAYALVDRGDWGMASIFLANAAGCAAICLIATYKRKLPRLRGSTWAAALR